MTETHSFTFTAEPMIPAQRLPWWRRIWWRLLRRPLPKPTQPPGTVPVLIETRSDEGLTRRVYIPAARVQPADAAEDE